MSDKPTDRLYNLLPSIYRLRDAEQGEPLRALLRVIASQFEAIESDITGLYENAFIETCDEWVIPYIGDLLSVRGLFPVSSMGFSQRAYVANTLSYRRAKGTAEVLRRIARDVTGWPARAVEFFELLATTQHFNHVRLHNHRTPDIRNTNQLNLLDTAFDRIARTAEVRRIASRRGKYNIMNVGLFLWRLQSYEMKIANPALKAAENALARQAAMPNSHGYHFSPLGNPAPLFTSIGEAGAPEELLVPSRIRPTAFYLDLKAYEQRYESVGPLARPANSDYYGPERSFYIIKDGNPVPPIEVMCKDLTQWDRPPAGKVAVDVSLGRLAFASGEEPQAEVRVGYSSGFSGDIGGGPYDRRETVAEITTGITLIRVRQATATDTLQLALQAWVGAGKAKAVIRIEDNSTYEIDLENIELPNQGWLVIEAADGKRPHLKITNKLTLTGPQSPATAADVATLKLSGLLVEGPIEAEGKLALEISDCALVPGLALDEDGFALHADQPSLSIIGTDLSDLAIRINRSITGPLQIPEACQSLTVSDSLIDAPVAKGETLPARAAISSDTAGNEPGPATVIERSTVFGKVMVKELTLASEVIFATLVVAVRKQTGCVRFSYVPEGSAVPRRYYCQPDLALARRAKELGFDGASDLPPDERADVVTRTRPRFNSKRFGRPEYAQLSTACAEEIRTGAEDGAEMGVFCFLKQPQREANLREALKEYLRFGLEAGIFFVT